jgi:hypothetical protein
MKFKVRFFRDAPLAAQAEREAILALARDGDETSRHRATVLGHALNGDQREQLFAEVHARLGQAKGVSSE